MYGYPEQFIPAPELVGYGAAPTVGDGARVGVGAVSVSSSTKGVTA